MNLQQQQQIKSGQAFNVQLERIDGEQLRMSWSWPGRSIEKLSIYYSASPIPEEQTAPPIAIVTQGGQLTFTDPAPGRRGYYFVQVQDEEFVPVAERVLPLRGALNFRDMGGYAALNGRTVKWGKLFRSAELSRLTDSDLQYLKALNLAWICDLRTDLELKLNPSPRIGNEKNEQLSFMSSANPEEILGAGRITESLLADMNRQMVANTALTAQFFRRLLELEGSPFLFHCAAGKDRTGFLASMILQALGVDREMILSDYTLTNLFAEQFKAGMRGKKREIEEQFDFMNRLTPELANALMEARPAYLAAAFEEIDARYGDFECYWTDGLGLAIDELERLRHDYLC